MDIWRLRPITRHVRVILRCDNYRQGKFGKFIKSKFKILTCVVLLGRLHKMRGISAGKRDKGNKSIMMRGIWVGEIWNIYCYQLYIYCLSLALPCCSLNHNQLLKDFLFAFKIFFDQILAQFFFMGGFNRRCSYDQAVFSKFMPRIVLCGRPAWKPYKPSQWLIHVPI